jgi:uncharacterized protein
MHGETAIPKEQTMQSVTKLPAPDTVTPSTADIDGWVVIDGAPRMTTWVLHTAADGTMMAGLWECTPGTYHATYSAYEFVHLIAGRIVITPDGGTPVTVVAGDAFVVEKDFKGTWKIEEHVRKHFDFRID